MLKNFNIFFREKTGDMLLYLEVRSIATTRKKGRYEQ